MIVTALTAIPMGVGAGVYLEEYAPKNWFTALIEINIANLAGVPSIVYGLMALGPVRLPVPLRPERAVRRAHTGFADLTDRHRRHSRIHPRCSGKHERSGLCSWCDEMANHQRSRLALLHGRHLDRRHHRPFSSDRRNRAVDHHRRP